ncbi:MAG TPA: hypothetical protein VF277_05810 [Steroidobacteraceae bacterium]
MTIYLEVDTDELRHACSALRRAAESQCQPVTLPDVVSVAGALHRAEFHGPAGVREALRLTVRRAEQGLEAARRLANVSLYTATSLESSAEQFDRIEQQLAAGN